ncbi:MAG: hypothetical protein VW405_02635 [Rhodospirillaceae bacterium]
MTSDPDWVDHALARASQVDGLLIETLAIMGHFGPEAMVAVAGERAGLWDAMETLARAFDAAAESMREVANAMDDLGPFWDWDDDPWSLVLAAGLDRLRAGVAYGP